MVNLDLYPQRRMEKAALSLSQELQARQHPARTPWGIVSRLEQGQSSVRRIDLVGVDTVMQDFGHTDYRRGTDLAAGIIIGFEGGSSILLECQATRLGLTYARQKDSGDPRQHEIPIINFHDEKYKIPAGSVPRRLREMSVQGATVLIVDEEQLASLTRATRDAINRITISETWHEAGAL